MLLVDSLDNFLLQNVGYHSEVNGFMAIINVGVPLLYKHSEKVDIINPFKPGFSIVFFIHYKPRIAVAILDL